MGSMHIRVLNGIDEIEAITVVEPNWERRARVERFFPRTRVLSDLDTALSDALPDFACVAVPVEEAPKIAGRLIDRGIPLLVEKPMASSLDEARAMAKAADEREVMLSVGYVERFNPAVQALREELRRGTGGTVYHVHARRLSPFPQRAGLPGVATDLATHDLDVMRFLVGSDPVRVYAESETLGASRGEDLICASLRFTNGVTGLIEANWRTPRKVRELSVTAEAGLFVVDYLTQDLFFHEQPAAPSEWEALGVMRGANEGRTIRFALDRREPLAVEWETFLAALSKGAAAPVHAEDGIAALTLAEAVKEAGRTHRPVDLGHGGR